MSDSSTVTLQMPGKVGYREEESENKASITNFPKMTRIKKCVNKL